MSEIKQRMAVSYKFFKDFDTTAMINDGIRRTYDGPLSLAQDFMTWTVTKEKITVRMAVVNEEVWPPPATETPMPPDPSHRIPYTDTIANGRLDVTDVLQPIYDEINKKYGLNEKPD